MSTQLLKVKVVNDDGFYIGIAFGRHRVASEFDIGWREDTGLGIVDVGVFHKGQVAGASRNGHV